MASLCKQLQQRDSLLARTNKHSACASVTRVFVEPVVGASLRSVAKLDLTASSVLLAVKI